MSKRELLKCDQIVIYILLLHDNIFLDFVVIFRKIAAVIWNRKQQYDNNNNQLWYHKQLYYIESINHDFLFLFVFFSNCLPFYLILLHLNLSNLHQAFLGGFFFVPIDMPPMRTLYAPSSFNKFYHNKIFLSLYADWNVNSWWKEIICFDKWHLTIVIM